MISAELLKRKKTTVDVFFYVKCNGRHLFYKVFNVLGAKKNPTRFSKYESVRAENDK
jgi:hypothetical protein